MQNAMLKDRRHEVGHFLDEQGPSVQIARVSSEKGLRRMASDVARGLSDPARKTLPCTYFYDRQGSELYEEITGLPEYYPTRCEASLLHDLRDELAAITKDGMGATPQLVELGSGSSSKTRLLLDAWDADRRPVTYIPVDISEAMLTETARDLAQSYRQIRVLGLCGQYEDALAMLPPQANRLFVFLGGTVGNFSPEYQRMFFRKLAARSKPGTRLLLGFDRVPHEDKPRECIEAAYNDRSGVTARFNLNILAHINRKLGANFDLNAWRHEAIYNETNHQIEMYLESLTAQEAHLSALEQTVRFDVGERILTEISRKFDPERLANWFARQGYQPLRCWTDNQQWVGLMLLEIVK